MNFLKISFLVFFLLFSLVSFVLADNTGKVSIAGTLGFTGLDLYDINDDIKMLNDVFGVSSKEGWQEFRGSFILGASARYWLDKNWQVGAGMELNSINSSIKLLFGDEFKRYTYKVYMFPLYFDLFYNFNPEQKFNYSLGASLAYVFAGLERQYFDSSSLTAYKIPYAGSGLGLRFFLEINNEISKDFSVFGQFGYRMANVVSVEATRDVDLAGIEKGDNMIGFFGKEMDIDMSGFYLNFGAKFIIPLE